MMSRKLYPIPFFMLLLLMLVTVASAQESSVVSYDLGEATILQTQFEASSRFYEMSVSLKGVLAVPSGDGPFPVALFLHGAYTFCTAEGEFDADAYPCPPENDLKQYEGFTELAQALANRGYIAIVPDLSAEFNNGYSEPIFGNRAIQIIKAHLDALAAGAAFGLDVTGKADFTRLVVAGHSRGGALSIRFLGNASSTGYAVSALAMLTPAFFQIEENIPQTLSVALVMAECDGDVGTDQPLMYLEQQLPPLRNALTVLYTLPKGTHNAFSTQLGNDPRDVCEGETILEAKRQRAFTADFLPDFFDLALSLSNTP